MLEKRSIFRYYAFSLAFMLGSLSLFAQAQEPAEDIRGPKPLIEIPVPAKPPYLLWSAIGGGLLLLAAGWFIWRTYRRKQHRKSPPEIALAALAELDSNRDSLVAEVFANHATHTIRQYIADRFGLAAPRRTTEEFLRDLLTDDQPSLFSEGDQLRIFLKSCDLAKFAGSNLDSNQRAELVDAARRFIHSTSTPVTP